jgi:hypothetical protein
MFYLKRALLCTCDDGQHPRFVLYQIPLMPLKGRKQVCREIRIARKNEHHISMSAILGKEERMSFGGTQGEIVNYVAFCRITIRRRDRSSGNLSLQNGTCQFTVSLLEISHDDIIALAHV